MNKIKIACMVYHATRTSTIDAINDIIRDFQGELDTNPQRYNLVITVSVKDDDQGYQLVKSIDDLDGVIVAEKIS